jgi:hypothetical protein
MLETPRKKKIRLETLFFFLTDKAQKDLEFHFIGGG